MYQQQQRDPRAQYHPPPPPPPLTPAQSHGNSYIPPPPPRPMAGMNHSHSHGQSLPPPPPGGPQSVPYWNRSQYPPPPSLQGPVAPYNPGAYGAYSAVQTPVEPPDQPLTSATYYPSGESFGPGVGIPPLDPSGPRPNQDSYYSFEDHSRPRNRSDVAAREREKEREAREEAETVGYPSIHNPAVHNSAGSLHYQPSALSRSPHGASAAAAVAAATSSSPKDPGLNWPLDTVLAWLSEKDFSDDWLRTFKKLDLHGSQFLDLGRGHSGRGNLNVLHSDIYPRLAKECTSSGTGWDQLREREEGKRLRRLIRQVVDEEGPPNIKTTGRSSFFTSHESQDGSTPSTAGGTGGESPDFRSLPASGTGQTIAQRRLSKNGQKTSLTAVPSPDLEAPRTESGNTSQTHSPANSRDASAISTAHRLDLGKNSREQSPQLSPAVSEIKSQSGKSSGPPSAAAARSIGHRRVMSSSDFMGPVASPGTPSTQAPSHDHRRNFTETDRLPVEAAKSSGSENPPNSAKESRGFFGKFRRAKDDKADKTKDAHSPVSPVGTRSVFGNSKVNASETSLDRPQSAVPDMKKSASSTLPMQRSGSQQHKRFVMITPDGWNYRLMDVSQADSLDTFYDLVRYNLGVAGTLDLELFVTVPGQLRHDDALSNPALQNALKTAGPDGLVKLYVRTSQGNLVSSTLSARFPSATKDSLLFNGSQEEASLSKLTPVDDAERTLVFENDRAPTSALDEKSAASEAERRSQLEAEAAKYREQNARKQQAYLEERKASNRFVDFDEPRVSPGEEKRTELIPKRAPPPAPPDPSDTMKKANSLSKRAAQGSVRHSDSKKKAGETYDGSLRTRQKKPADSPNPASGIAGAIAGAGSVMAAPGRGAGAEQDSAGAGKESDVKRQLSSAYSTLNTSSSKKSSSGTQSGLQPRPSMHSRLPSNPNLEKLRGQRPGSSGSTEGSPTTPPQSGSLSRKSTRGSRHGPTLDFTETHVAFDRAAEATPEVSDEDSDGDLFAVPLRGQEKAKGAAPSKSPSPDSRAGKPSLKLQTPSASRVSSVSFEDKDNKSVPVSPRDESKKPEARPRKEAEPPTKSSWSPESPELHTDDHDKHDNHRNSVFEIDDGWANRPQAEALIEDLDKFFPQIDLDQPIVDEQESPPSSPLLQRGTRGGGKQNENQHSQTSPAHDQEDADTVRSLESVAQRNMRKSRGNALGRAKSIRDVVRSNYSGAHGGQALQRNPTVKGSALGRKKSTKVNGAIATEVKPAHSRLGLLETIHQDKIAVAPRRQATFKWMKGQLIGKGTFGRVYLGMNIGTGELLAVKQVEVKPSKAGQDKEKVREMVKALDREIDTMQRLDHENIVQYLGCERKEYSISIFLEYISGGSVGSCLRKHGKFEETVVSSLTRQVLDGLAYLHDEGILHRDLKADNILLDMDGVCKISDFGISKRSNDIYVNDASNSMQGSVFWMAPEVVRSQGDGYSAKVDIWSLGCVVLEMFQGKRPFAGDELVGAIFKLGSLNQPPPIPNEVSKTISVVALSFMFDCWNIDPKERPTAKRLLASPFTYPNGDYNWYDTTLYAKIKTPPVGGGPEPRVGSGDQQQQQQSQQQANGSSK